MRRPTHLATPLLAAAALSILTGCRPSQMQRCADETGRVVPDGYCAGQSATQERRPDGHGGFFFIPHIYRPYYGGIGGYNLGDRVTGGSFNASPGVNYASPSGGHGFFSGHGISRGGFGGSFSGGGQ